MIATLLGKLGAGLAATAVVGAAATAVVVTKDDGPEPPVVSRHIDGDTIEVTRDGSPEKIRLLNIDTPETKDPSRPVQCLGPEAADFLARLIPVGTEVRLEFDSVLRDRYGRTLAAVFTPDGRMVNAEVARAGFAQVVTYDDNVRFRPPIEAAAAEAVSTRRGLHAPEVACTVPGQIAAAVAQVEQAPKAAEQPPDRSAADLNSAAHQMATALAAVNGVLRFVDTAGDTLHWASLTAEEQSRLRGQAVAAQDVAQREHDTLRGNASSAAAREAAAVRAEAQRVAREQAAARAAEQREAARVAAAERAARQREAAAARRAEQSLASPSDDGDSSSSGGGSKDGYTGPRCYAPGGKTYRPC